jgi:hypothetical protein
MPLKTSCTVLPWTTGGDPEEFVSQMLEHA